MTSIFRKAFARFFIRLAVFLSVLGIYIVRRPFLDNFVNFHLFGPLTPMHLLWAILMGDMNARPSDEAIRMCNEFEPYPLTDVTKEIPCTFRHFGRLTDCKIDYIFVTDEFKDKITGVGIWEDQINGSYLSDHYPVWMDVQINE